MGNMVWEVYVSKINDDEVGEFQRGEYTKSPSKNKEALVFGTVGKIEAIEVIPKHLEKTNLYEREVSEFTMTEGIPEENVCRYLYQNGEEQILILTGGTLGRRRLAQTP